MSLLMARKAEMTGMQALGSQSNTGGFCRARAAAEPSLSPSRVAAPLPSDTRW